MSKLDLNVQLYDYIPHGKFQRGKMRLIFSGNDANTQFVNSIGRIMMDRIPTYAFARELINVERIDPESGYRGSVAVNHDMITLALKDIPVSNMDPKITYLHEKYWKNVNYLDPNREAHPSEKRIELYIDIRNDAQGDDEDSYLPVTTNNMEIFVDDEVTQLHDRDYPYYLMSLKPGEQLRLSARAVLGVGLNDACWQAASNYAIDDETEEGSVILMFQAASRFDEFELMERALSYYAERVTLISSMMTKMFLAEPDKTERFIALISGEDATIGTPLAYELQSHPDVVLASSGIPDNLVEKVRITIVADPDKIQDIIKDSSDNLIKKIERIQKQFADIRKESYSKYLDKNGKSLFYDINHVLNEDPVQSKTSKSASSKESETKSKETKSKTTKTPKKK